MDNAPQHAVTTPSPHPGGSALPRMDAERRQTYGRLLEQRAGPHISWHMHFARCDSTTQQEQWALGAYNPRQTLAPLLRLCQALVHQCRCSVSVPGRPSRCAALPAPVLGRKWPPCPTRPLFPRRCLKNPSRTRGSHALCWRVSLDFTLARTYLSCPTNRGSLYSLYNFSRPRPARRTPTQSPKRRTSPCQRTRSSDRTTQGFPGADGAWAQWS